MAKQPPSRRDPEPEYGPAMRALPPKWRRFVENLFMTDANATESLRLAGYTAKPASMKVMAHRVMHDDRVRAAIREESRRCIDTSGPEVLAVVRKVMREATKDADRLRAASMLWDRSDPVITHHRVEVEHHITEDERDILHYRALQRLGAPHEKFLARFGRNGLPRVEALVLAEEARRREIEAPTIEVDYDEVPNA